MSPALVIFLHGVGSRGSDLAPLGGLWRDLLPAVHFAAPDGPFAFDQGGTGRQWFSVRGVTEANRPERILAARAAFDDMIGGLITKAGLADRLDRVALVGFSQGAIMALDAVVSGRWPVAGVVACSGRLASPLPFAPVLTTPVLLIHGDADPVMPVGESASAESRLSAAGVAVRRHVLPSLGHGISPEGGRLAGHFLADVLASPAG